MRHPELVVGALLVNDQGEVFVARFSKVAGQYAIPGGHVEYGETIAGALVREMREETGLTPVRCKLLRVGERIRPPLYKDGTHHLVYLDFVVDRWTGELQLDGEELSDGLWLTPEAALDLPLTFTTRQAIEFYLAHGADGACDYQPGQVD
jgi:mutator protein MutT